MVFDDIESLSDLLELLSLVPSVIVEYAQSQVYAEVSYAVHSHNVSRQP